MRRHLDGMAAGSRTHRDVLLGLTSGPVAENQRLAIAAEAAATGVTFAAVTFTQVAAALRQQCAEYEHDLAAIIEDYEGYLSEAGLLDERNRWLPVFACGQSISENARFGLYYESPSRPCKRNHRFIGIYDRMAVRYVGTVQAIAVVSHTDGVADFSVEAGQLTDGHRARIERAVAETRYYDLGDSPNRFYLVDGFVETMSAKTSPGGMRALRYLDLPAVARNYDARRTYTAAELATALRGTEWQ